MATPTQWDVQRRKARGDHGNAGVPKCRKCGQTSVLDPCRTCASPEQRKKYPPAP